MPKPGLGFEYDIGQYVTHERDGNVPPPRYTVVSRLFETGPDGPQRFYVSQPDETAPFATSDRACPRRGNAACAGFDTDT